MRKQSVMKIAGWLLVFISLSPAALAAIRVPKEEAVAEFIKAGTQYKDSHYDEAIKLYEEVIRSGWAGGPLYYNLGNTYFQKGSLGKAILNYERARRLTPRDHDLQANYQYALTLIKNPLTEPGRPSWPETFSQLFGFFTLDELALIIVVLTVITGSLCLLFLYLGWNHGRRFLFPLSLIVLIFAVGFIGQMKSEGGLAVVTAETTAKFEPRQEGTTHFDLPEGSRIKVLKKDGVWVKIVRPDGKEGWVPQDTVENI